MIFIYFWGIKSLFSYTYSMTATPIDTKKSSPEAALVSKTLKD